MYNTKYFLLLKKVKKMYTRDFQNEFDLSQPHANKIMSQLSKLIEIKLEHELVVEKGHTFVRAFVIYKPD